MDKTVYDLLAEADILREKLYEQAVLLRKVAADPNAVRKISDKIREVCDGTR